MEYLSVLGMSTTPKPTTPPRYTGPSTWADITMMEFTTEGMRTTHKPGGDDESVENGCIENDSCAGIAEMNKYRNRF